MSSDEAYSAFLDQANQDTGTSNASTQSSHAQLKATDTDIPAALQGIDQTYTSEADEPFEPVSLKWTGRSMPSESILGILLGSLHGECQLYEQLLISLHERADDFAGLIGHKAEVSTLSTQEFDPKGEYKGVMEAVEKAGDGKVRVFRVEVGSTRVWYYVVGWEKEAGKVVGVRAKAVES
ncbi:hypothetical protein MMC18_002487 [Xylographa bjoerkii]|nr:hypothetical protein [Xylographa bjoerkii]